jgi:F-type H+-transporting ATPase subunit b
MSFPLLFLAQASSAASGGMSDTVTKITNDFGLQVPSLIAQIVNFAIVAALLWWFAFKPILAGIEDRQKKIDSGLKYAEEMKAKLEAAQQSSDAQIKEAQLKGQQLVAEAQKAAKEFSEKQQQEAIEKANAILTKAQAAIDLEKKKMLAEARSEIARLVVSTTQRVLAKELSELERGRFNEAAARELANV